MVDFSILGGAADSIGYIVALNDAIDNIHDDVHGKTVEMMKLLFVPAKAAMVLYVIVWGLAAMRGSLGEPIMDSFIRMFKFFLVVFLALKAPFYQNYVESLVLDTPEQIFEQITGVGTDVLTNVTLVFNFVFQMGNSYLKESSQLAVGGIPNLPYLFLGATTWLAGMGLSALVLSTLLIAKLMLWLLLEVGPVFILMMLFESTKRLFDAWLGQVIKYMITLMLLAFGLLMVFEILKNALLTFVTGTALNAIVSGALGASISPIKGLGVLSMMTLCGLIIKEIPLIATDIGRSISTNLLTGQPKK